MLSGPDVNFSDSTVSMQLQQTSYFQNGLDGPVMVDLEFLAVHIKIFINY